MGEGLPAGLEPAVAVIERLARALVESETPLDRVHLEAEVRRLARREAPLARPDELRRVVDELVGLGPVESLLDDPEVADILINGPDEIWVERRGRLERVTVAFRSAEAVVAAVERVIAPLGLRLDRAAPTVDARLPDGSRLHAVIPPAAVDGPVVAIRRFTQAVPDVDAFVAGGGADLETMQRLTNLVATRKNIIVSGGTGTGKTTLLNLLSRSISPEERVVVIEDAAELSLGGHVVRLEARPANSEGGGEITLNRLVRSALRLRPDRIILGEVRGPEALDLISALNTGHAGSMSTVHANSPAEARWRLETLALSGSARLPARAIRRQLGAAIQVFVQLERVGTVRRIASLEEIAG
jgi:pilus assembly protein CpaF